ncbi:MAG: glycosyltransferase [Candidatus Heimdallarchaeota archaeon]|nr:glycosyltransferase [Candidatus Heimdallarchaeota archaeon]MCK4769259.1 glycosyltransferase [Candidatus Heimdallarchaeota archaeon]
MKILLISYFFPPSTSVGGLRALSFKQYLPEDGIDVVILTSGTKQDIKQNFLENTNHSNIYYCKETKLRELGYKTKILPVLELFSLDHLFFFPDIYFKWIKSAFKVGNEVIKKEKPDIIYATGPPFSSFKAAYKLSKKNDIPLVLEYRDPWLGNPYTTPPCKSITKRISKLEKRILTHSRLLITVGNEYAEFIAEKLEIKKSNFKIVHNGFFPDIPYKNTIKKNENIFTISFFGSFYSFQKPIFEEFIKGLRLMIEEKELKSSEIKLQYAGSVSRSVINKMIAKGKIETYFNDMGFLSREKLNEEIQKSNLVFLTVPKGTEYMLQTKIYNYLVGNSHIMLIGESGAMAKLCDNCQQKFTELESDKDKIASRLSKLYEDWRKNRLEYGCNKESFEEYNRRNLALKLGKIIKTTFKKTDK